MKEAWKREEVEKSAREALKWIQTEKRLKIAERETLEMEVIRVEGL